MIIIVFRLIPYLLIDALVGAPEIEGKDERAFAKYTKAKQIKKIK